MGIFTRMRDIISSNINAMLDQAENPEKLLRLMLQEMEDTLIEVKVQCAESMAQLKSLARQIAEAEERAERWAGKARLAIEKGREDLAREALREKRAQMEQAEALKQDKADTDMLVEKAQADISQLEAKMATVRERQKVLAQRHAQARTRRRAQQNIRRVDSSDVMARFDAFEQRIDRMEAEADLVNYGRPAEPLEQEFDTLEGNGELERELEALRNEVRGRQENQ